MNKFESKWSYIHAALGILLACTILAAPFIAEYFLKAAQ